MADSKEIFGNITGVKVFSADTKTWSEWKTSSSDIYKEYILPKIWLSQGMKAQLLYRVEYDSEDWEARRLTFYGNASFEYRGSAGTQPTLDFINTFDDNDFTDGSMEIIIANTQDVEPVNPGETKQIRFYGPLSSTRYFTGERTAYFKVHADNGSDQYYTSTFQAVKCGAISVPPELSISAIPISLPGGHSVTIKAQNRSGVRLYYEFTVNGQTLYRGSSDSDTYQVTTLPSWFDNAGITGNSMSVSVAASDEYGRTASTGFTLTRPQAPVVTLTSPTSGTKDGAAAINFVWTISAGSGTVTGTQMQYSIDDGINWNTLVESESSIESYQSAAGKFQPGKVSWRVRAKDSLAGWGEWRSASFTVSYTPASITLTSPTSGQRDGSGEIPFAWNITNGSGSIVKTIMEVSTDDGLSWTEKVNKNEKATSYTAGAAQFPAGALKWRVKAKNQYQADYTVSSTGNVTIVYSAVSQIKTVNSPISGRVPASVDQTYAVALTPSAPVYTPFTIQSATMYWRAGTSGDYTAVPMTASGANASVTIPGGTFPSGTIQWYAEAVDNTGATRTTDVYTLLALNASVEAVPLSPINTIEGTSSEITFTWLYYSLDGTAQSRALLEYSRDGESWDTIADVLGSDTTYTAPAGFFTSAGVVYWRVQAFNASGTAGPKSAAVSFTLFGSSSVTSVIGDGKPFATVKWQAEGQVSYELMIGDKHIGPYFGADVRSYKLAEPLEDGLYTVRARIQNKYGIWSEWAETQMSVQNQPGLGIIIQDAQSSLIGTPYTYRGSISILSFAPGDFFMILRDGKYIGKTTRLYFEDRIPIGVHRYQVYQALADGYVDRSNIITIDVKTKYPVIAPLAGGDFIELRLSTEEDRAQDFQRSREVARMHYSGARYPSSEVGEAETLSVSFDAAWKQTDKAAADAFEALVGEDVIFKTPGGKFIVGTLEGYELHDPHFYKSYRCSLQQGDWRDFTNADA